jgi:hypothetical protein
MIVVQRGDRPWILTVGHQMGMQRSDDTKTVIGAWRVSEAGGTGKQ